MAKDIETRVREDGERFRDQPKPTAEAVEKVRPLVVAEYVRPLLIALETGGTLRSYSIDKADDTKVYYAEETAVSAVQALKESLRKEFKDKENNDKVIYPSRPMLAALAVRRLIGEPLLFDSHFLFAKEPTADLFARWMVLRTLGEQINDTVNGIDRAEGVLKTTVMTEAAFWIGDTPLTEAQIASRAARFQNHADRLVNDKSGVGVLEGNIVKLVASMTGIPTPGETGTIAYDHPMVNLTGQLLATEAFRLIHPHTA